MGCINAIVETLDLLANWIGVEDNAPGLGTDLPTNRLSLPFVDSFAPSHFLRSHEEPGVAGVARVERAPSERIIMVTEPSLGVWGKLLKTFSSCRIPQENPRSREGRFIGIHHCNLQALIGKQIVPRGHSVPFSPPAEQTSGDESYARVAIILPAQCGDESH